MARGLDNHSWMRAAPLHGPSSTSLAPVPYGRFMPGWPDWTGLSEKKWSKGPEEEIRPAKTLWDWLQLVAVPLALAILALLFNGWQSGREAKREESRAAREREIAREGRLDAVLQTYITQLSRLMLEDKLRSSREGSDVRVAARTLTLAAVRRLDGARKGEVVRYLADSRLIEGRSHRRGGAILTGQRPPKLQLSDADLRGADLRGASLFALSLSGADLRGARFDGADLLDVDLTSTRMQGSSFRGASFGDVDFARARLDRAVFDGAQFQSTASPQRLFPTLFDFACLTDARFRDAYLEGAIFRNGIGVRVDFSRAVLSGRALREAELQRTTIGKAELHGDVPPGWGSAGVKRDIASRLTYFCNRAGIPGA
jgi:hypothetical protein